MSDIVKFKRGQSANVDSTTIVPGQVLVSTDTGEIHVDYTDSSDSTNKRVQIKDSTKVEDVQLSDPYNNNRGIDINIIKNGSVDSSIIMGLANGLQVNKHTSSQTNGNGETTSTLTTYELGMIPPVIMVGNRNSQTMTYTNNLNEEVEYNKITFDKYTSSSFLISMTDKDFRKDRLYVDADDGEERIYRWIEFRDKNYVTHSTFIPLYSYIYDEIINSLGYTPAEINDNQISSSTTWSSSKISNTITNTLSDTVNATNFTGVLPITKGGTGGSDRATALYNLVKADMLTDNNGNETYDLDLYTDPGYWYFAGTMECINGPLITHQAGYLFVIKGGGSNVKQYYTLQAGAYELQNETYVRTYSSGWTDWQKINSKIALIGSNENNSNGWYKVAYGTLTGYSNTSLIFAVHSTGDYKSGILVLDIQNSNGTTNTCRKLGWLVRHGFDAGDCCVVCDTNTNSWTLYHRITRSRYYFTAFEVISEAGLQQVDGVNKFIVNPRYRLYNSSTKLSADPVATATSIDIGSVSNADTVNGLTVQTAVPSNAEFTDTKVTNTLATTTKAYITGTTSATTNTGTQVFDTGVYLDTTAGTLHTDGTITCSDTVYDLSTSPVFNTTSTGISVLQKAKIEGSTDTFPILWATNTNNNKNGSGVGLSGNGLTIVAGGENGIAGILNNAAQQSGTTLDISGSSTTYITPQTEELVLSADSGISFFPGATSSNPSIRVTTTGIDVNGTINGAVPYGSCSTAAATAAKAVTVTGTFILIAGARVIVKFTVTNTASNPTLNVNSTGDKSIYYRGSAITAGYLAANRTYEFIYNGTQYELVGDIDTNTTYSSKAAASGGTDVSLVTTGEKYIWNNKSTLAIGTTSTTAAAGNHTHTLSLATDSGTNALTLAASTKYKLTAGGSSYIFTTPPNTNTHYTTHLYAGSGTAANTSTTNGNTKITVVDDTTVRDSLTIKGANGASVASDANGIITVTNSGVRSIATGSSNGTISVNTNGTSANVAVKGLGTAAYTASTDYVAKAGDTMTGALYVDVTSSSLPNMVSTDTYVRGLYGVRLSNTVATPLIYCATQNNSSAGAGICFSGKGLTIIGAGKNGPSGILNNAAQKSGTTLDISGSSTTYITPQTKELVLSADSGISFFPGAATTSPSSKINNNGTFVGPTGNAAIESSLDTTTYLNGNQGIALVNSTAAAGNYVALLKSNSLNGYFTVANHSSSFKLQYTTKDTVDASTNSITKSATLLNESGNSSFPGNINASGNIVAGGTVNSNYLSGRTSGSTVGTDSIAVGAASNTASAARSYAMGRNNVVTSSDSFAFGNGNQLSGGGSLGIGYQNIGSTQDNFMIGISNAANTNTKTMALGFSNTTTGAYSFAAGRSVTTSGENSYAIGGWNTTNAELSTIIGDNNTISESSNSFIFGSHNEIKKAATGANNNNMALGHHNTIKTTYSAAKYCYALGYKNTVYGPGVAMGYNNTLLSDTSGSLTEGNAVAIGFTCKALKNHSTAIGYYCNSNSNGQFVCGRENKSSTTINSSDTSSTTGDVFIVGNGYVSNVTNNVTTHTVSNAFRVTYTGAVYAKAAYNSSGADYAEFIKEWYDGNPDNEDRVGYMVTIGEDNKLHKANSGDYIIGITSGNPSVIGNADEDYFWMYERDEFNRPVYEEVDDFKITTDEDGNQCAEPTGEKVKRFKFREGYDPSLQDSYIERAKRPEWDYVGMRGIVPCRDDGTCVPRGFCKCGSDGIATKADTRGFDTYYVVERISENVVSIEVK